MFLFFWRTFRLLHANFFTDVFGTTQRVNALKKPFRNISTSAGRHFDVFWELFPIKKFCTDVFFITLTVIVLKKLHSTYLFAEGIKQYFWTYFEYIPQCLEKLKTFSWCFGRISTYYCGGQWTKKCIGLPSFLDIFVCFWSILYYAPQILGSHLTFSYELFLYL